MGRRPDEVREWLRAGPALSAVIEAYPAEWEQVNRHVGRLAESGDDGAVTGYLRTLAAGPRRTPGHRRPDREEVSDLVRRYLVLTAVKQAHLRSATGADGGTVRLGLVSGTVLQRLLFRRGLERKPVSYQAFRLVWPLVRQRRRLMPLVRERGIYCFYTSALVDRLAGIVGDRPCLEVAAGDGTLARFLADRGVDVTATDDQSWAGPVEYPAHVRKQSAAAALREHAPSVVLCSWPPPGNRFERQVLATPSVQTYLVVTTRQRAEAGDWDAYLGTPGFDLVEHADLGRLVVPHELDGVVLELRRRPVP